MIKNANFSQFQARHLVLLLSAVLLSACSDGSDSSNNTSTGTLDLAIADAPVDNADNVVVEFSGVELKPANGEPIIITYDNPRQIDLLQLSGGVSTMLLEGHVLDAGRYDWVRLMVNTQAGVRDSYIMVNGSEYEMDIPGDAQSGLKLNRGFTITKGGTSALTIDFDLRQSVRMPQMMGGDYMLRPTLRMVDNTNVGMLSGAIDSNVIANQCGINDKAAVYMFDASVSQPDDVDGMYPESIATAMVSMDSQYAYTAAFMEAGTYMIAFTCDAANDDPDTDDTVTFTGFTTVSISIDQMTMHNFMPQQ